MVTAGLNGPALSVASHHTSTNYAYYSTGFAIIAQQPCAADERSSASLRCWFFYAVIGFAITVRGLNCYIAYIHLASTYVDACDRCQL